MTYTIFYIDDEADLLEMFVDSHASDEFEIHVFTQPQDLLEALGAKKPDLVLIDFRLPGTNGDHLAQQIDQKLKRSVPKALITGDLRISPTSRFIKIFSKPYDPHDMQKFLDSGDWRKASPKDTH